MELETSKTILSMEHLLRWKDNGYISYWLLHLGADPLKKDSSGDPSNQTKWKVKYVMKQEISKKTHFLIFLVFLYFFVRKDYDHGKYLSPCEILKCSKLLLASVAFSQGRTPIDLINPLTSDPQAGAVGWNEQHLKNGTKIVRSIGSILGSSIDLQQRLIYKWKGIEETER